MTSTELDDKPNIGFTDSVAGGFFDFYVNNTFYLLAPEYYYNFYANYLNRCLACYDGWIAGFHNYKEGIVPQRMLQSITRGLNNMVFAHGIDFKGTGSDYYFAVDWAKKTKFYKALKKAHKFAIAGGTSLLKLNRENGELYATAHRIDTFFADIDASGKIVSVQVYFDIIHNTNPSGSKRHFGLCEERYFNAKGEPCIMTSVYEATSTLQTSVQDRPQKVGGHRVGWEKLPPSVREYIKKNFPSALIGVEQYLPFANSLGCCLLKFTEDIPQIPNIPFGQPIGDILFTESFQYDQMKLFERNEVYLAKARALIPEEMWNKDDPQYGNHALSEMFYQKVASLGDDQDKITQIQFKLRSQDIKVQKENIYKDCSFKLNVSASSIASFLSEGAGAKTATEIVKEATKSDTFIDSQIQLNAPEINDILRLVMLYYNRQPVEILFKAEDQSPYIDILKTNSDAFSAGNMSPKRFVKDTYKHLSQEEQLEEIRWLENTKRQKDTLQEATINSWEK